MHNRSKRMRATSKRLNDSYEELHNPCKGIRDSWRGMNYREHIEWSRDFSANSGCPVMYVADLIADSALFRNILTGHEVIIDREKQQ